jgi:acetyltransferase-like isoleucine patch superfamily enzyme
MSGRSLAVFSDFLYLWRNREKPGVVHRKPIVWLKRIYFFFATGFLLIRPVFVRWRGAKIGRLVILGRSRIQGDCSGLTIGDETSLGRCEIALHDKVHIGRRVVINDGALLLTASHFLDDPAWGHKKAPITIGDYAWIASNAIVLPGVTIGRGAVVGAGAVVREDVPDYRVAIGNPARLLLVQRTLELNYSPVMLNAPFEAWVGRCNGAG